MTRLDQAAKIEQAKMRIRLWPDFRKRPSLAFSGSLRN